MRIPEIAYSFKSVRLIRKLLIINILWYIVRTPNRWVSTIETIRIGIVPPDIYGSVVSPWISVIMRQRDSYARINLTSISTSYKIHQIHLPKPASTDSRS